MANHPKSPVSLDIVVVGAGLSGLAAAVSCALSGHRVTVFESAPALLEIGAGLQVTPNASRLLQQWEVPDKLWESAALPTYLAVHRYSGEILAMEENFHQKMKEKYGAPYTGLYRVDLQLSLYDRAKELGVQFKLGQKVETIDFSIPEITTQSRLTARPDLIVAADGLWSTCRSCFTTAEAQPQPTGDLAYRIVLDLDDIQDHELRAWVNNPSVHFWIGPGAHAVGYSIAAGRVYNLVLLVPDDLPPGVRRQTGSVAEMKELFKGWDPILTRFLNLVERVDKWKLMYRTAARYPEIAASSVPANHDL